MKTLWAVACAVAVSIILFLLGNGFAAANPIVVAQEASLPPAQKNSGNGFSQANETRGASQPAPAGNTKIASADYSGGPKYLIGPEDVLHISVWDNKDLTLDVIVRPDGKISLPLIQDVQAEGLTASELSDVIHQKLQPFILEPQVAVIVTQVNAPKVFVLGNVTRPGPYPLRSDMSVLQALSLAGGFTPFASQKNIKVVRNIKGKQEVRKVNYFDIVDDGSGNYLLKPGDMIVVP